VQRRQKRLAALVVLGGSAVPGREFLGRLARLSDRVREEIAAVPGRRKGAGQQADLQAWALLDRLLFLYFVQKKGLLDASPDYFYSRFLDGHAGRPAGTSFYRQVLYPLFLAVSDRGANRALAGNVGAVPFLGGGFPARPGGDQRHLPGPVRPAFGAL